MDRSSRSRCAETRTIARFELKKRFGLLSSYVYFVSLFACAFLTMISAGGAFSNVSVSTGSDKILANAPFQLSALLTILSHFGVLISAAVFGQAVYQDFESRSEAIFFTTAVRKRDYLGGRFLGALLFALFVFSSLALGLWVGTLMPFVERTLFGPNRAAFYLWPYLTIVLPNLLFTGALFFMLATLLRRMMPVYVGTVVLVIGYLMAGGLLKKLENKPLAALIDPFGLSASSVMTEYWTVAEKNSLLIPLRGLLLTNRLIWGGVGLILLAFTFYKFRFSYQGTTDRGKAKSAPEEVKSLGGGAIPIVTTAYRNWLSLLAGFTWLSFKETVKNVYFGVIVLAGVLFMIIASRQTGSLYGTLTYPVTHAILELSGGTFSLFLLIIITFYSGELVWRERDAGVDQILDALPTPNWLPFVSKLLALILVQVLLLGVVMVTSIGIQTAHGYFHYEPLLYLKDLFGLRLFDYSLLCVLAITVQTLVQNKYTGHFIMVLFYLWTLFMDKLGLEHNLYKFGGSPHYEYSDMNKFGHFVRPVFWFDLYWAAFALLLAILSNLLWVRGLETRFSRRWSLARQRFTGAVRFVAVATLIAFVGLGGFIFYNTNILNHYQTQHDHERERADYEKLYKTIAKSPQPRVTDVKVALDIFPERQVLIARGTYRISNKTSQTIQTVYLNLPRDIEVRQISVGAVSRPTAKDSRLGFYTFDLGSTPMLPGKASTIDFELAFIQHGFTNETLETEVVENGTFFSSGNLPVIGYRQDRELIEDGARKKYGLVPKERMADLNDSEARKNNYISSDADWVTFDATVSTSPDQIAIAPGYLQKEWTENGRRYFHYQMDSKILHFFSVLSARYQVKRDRWNDIPLEIYYHPGHEFDLDQMMKGMKAALDYCTTQFGPYQHRQVRIIEFPRYQSFAQSFPNTIPYSESVGFIAKVDPQDPEDIDYPFYITAHEVAHQWWAHQVIGGNVQGATMLSETMAQYSALMVMKKELGPEKMKRFLKYELEKYLRGRGGERKKERPLLRVENQPYIHYAKGSLVMYALQDYIGEAQLNNALSNYLNAVKFQEPPYTNALEMLGYIRKATPADLQYLIDDLFENITLYDNRVISATSQPLADGKYEVTLHLSAKKLRADSLGVEQEVPMNDLVDVGALNKKGEAIFLEKRRLHQGESEIKFTVAELPVKAGVDPLNKLIDRKPDNNIVNVRQN